MSTPSEFEQRLASWDWLAVVVAVVCLVTLYATGSDLPNF